MFYYKISINKFERLIFMFDKKESETLKQRKYAQEEFLKLKKIQQGTVSAEPKPSELYSTPMTLKEKFKNLWYHNKIAILLLTAITACIVLFTVQCATKTKYDATVVLFTYSITGDNNCKKIGEYLKAFCKDINNDGEVNINVINCSLADSQTNTEHSYTTRSKVASIIATNAEALLFITDEESYDYLMSLSENVTFFEDEPLKFNNDFYDFCNDADEFYPTPENMQISCRTIKDVTISNDKNIDIYYDQAQTILKGLKEKSN